jgi:hypothetical protein
VGNLAFLVFNGEAGALLWLGTVGSTGSFCALGNQVSWHPQTGKLPLSGRHELLLFDRVMGDLPQKGLVVSSEPLCSVGKEASWHQQNSKVWSLGFTSICGSRLLALSSKLWVPIGSKAGRLELSGVHNAWEALRVYLCWGVGF